MATTSGRGGGLTGPPKPPPHAAIQDGPPPGGYPPVDVRRNLPKVGPSGTTLLIGIGLITIYGFWGATKSAQRRRRLNQEKYQIRLAITPYLQAEQDRLEVKETHRRLRQEAELMKDVPEYQPGENLYKTRKFTPYVKPLVPGVGPQGL
jgi:NADH dehydrogenase (ubiquinone) 1 alpha subcomplex subunit 13